MPEQLNWPERAVHTRKVVGSIPTSGTIYAGLTQWKRVSLTRRKLWVRVPHPVPNPLLGSRKNLRNAKREQLSRSPYKSRIVFERSGGVKRPRKKSGKLNPQTTLKSLAKAMHYKQVAHLFLQQIYGSKTIVANRVMPLQLSLDLEQRVSTPCVGGSNPSRGAI